MNASTRVGKMFIVVITGLFAGTDIVFVLQTLSLPCLGKL